MKSCYIVLGVVFATMSLLPSPSEAQFPKCDSKLIKKIKSFQKGAGTPTNVLNLISDSEGIIAVRSSQNAINNGQNCLNYNSTNSSSLIATHQCYDPSCQPIVLNFDVEEYNGVITNTDGTIYRYVIFADNGVIATYACNIKEAIQGPLAGTIFATTQNYNDNSTQTTIRATEGLMDLLGFQFIYDFTTNCF